LRACRGNGVSIDAGLIKFTTTGSFPFATSIRSASVNALTACLPAESLPCGMGVRLDRTLPMLMSVPPRLASSGSATCEPWTTPQKLTSNRRCSSSSGTSMSLPTIMTPALFTQVSKPPKRSSAASAIRSTAWRSATSATTWTASGPRWRSCLVRVSSAFSLREARTSLAPLAEASRAVAKPMPLVAPVMTMIWSRSFFWRSFMSRVVLGQDVRRRRR
jgi:hypothetical protein